jgi:hypothetical protein
VITRIFLIVILVYLLCKCHRAGIVLSLGRVLGYDRVLLRLSLQNDLGSINTTYQGYQNPLDSSRIYRFSEVLNASEMRGDGWIRLQTTMSKFSQHHPPLTLSSPSARGSSDSSLLVHGPKLLLLPPCGLCYIYSNHCLIHMILQVRTRHSLGTDTIPISLSALTS